MFEYLRSIIYGSVELKLQQTVSLTVYCTRSRTRPDGMYQLITYWFSEDIPYTVVRGAPSMRQLSQTRAKEIHFNCTYLGPNQPAGDKLMDLVCFPHQKYTAHCAGKHDQVHRSRGEEID